MGIFIAFEVDSHLEYWSTLLCMLVDSGSTLVYMRIDSLRKLYYRDLSEAKKVTMCLKPLHLFLSQLLLLCFFFLIFKG